jgi:hypothetical protein
VEEFTNMEDRRCRRTCASTAITAPLEARLKLQKIGRELRPGPAHLRVSPADIAALMVWIEVNRRKTE